ncbi:proton-conducting transporter membrane subunit [Phytoactinopolyspora endophytica]|uniref:proton-conducting transporter transmembrane domain-containing protein n=1 Tax=Phytoactinopolyspora endophytica TaxID=1642495 RepID=UPI00101D3259|nr:proton-conducting transporter membrane subunit [Phytoactinopolyspora endophytica]
MSAAVPVLVLGPLLGSAISLLLGRWPWLQRLLGAVVLTGALTVAAMLLATADSSGPVVARVGGWDAPAGITLVADRLSALVLTIALAICLAIFLYAIGQGSAEDRAEHVPSVFHPTYLALVAGIDMALLSGDLFNLFVGLEVMLASSYVLITLGATSERVRLGATYIVVSLGASMGLLTTVALFYAVTGTVNLADLSIVLAEVPPAVRHVLQLMLLLVLATKAAVVPLHMWLPDSYPSAPAPITALFAALLTKIAVYALIRTQTLLFPRDEPWPLLLVLAGATMLVGVVGGLVQADANRLLCFLLVGHIGYMVFGLALATADGLRGSIIYLVHHMTAQAGLFLVIDLAQRRRGSSSLLGLGRASAAVPALSGLILLAALNFGSVPPLAGFVAKLALLQAAVADGTAWAFVVAAVAIVAALLTLAAMGRIFVQVYWGAPPADQKEPDGDAIHTGSRGSMRLMYGATTVVVSAGIALAVAAQPLAAVTSRAADDLTARTPYQQSVLGDLGGAS